MKRRDSGCEPRAILGCVACGAVFFLILVIQATVVSSIHAVTIEHRSLCNPLADVSLLGPIEGSVYAAHTFTATVGPNDAALPITYTWEATGQISDTHSIHKLSDTIQFVWKITGTKTVTVTAINECGDAVSDTRGITIKARHWYIYLPLVLRDYFYDPYEPNNTLEQAYGPLLSNQSYVAYIPDETDPDDYYFISIVSTARVEVRLDVPDELDLDLYVYDANRKPVAWSNLSGRGVDEAVGFIPTAAITHFIRVYPFAGWSKADPYTLTVAFDSPGY
jgi:hypothetical protein